jgi:clumping factor A
MRPTVPKNDHCAFSCRPQSWLLARAVIAEADLFTLSAQRILESTPMRRTFATSCFVAALVASGTAQAAPSLRVQVNQHGDFLLIGNTLGYDCASSAAIVVGTLAPDACMQSSSDLSDSSPDVFWRADAPVDGMALADTTTPASEARSTAVLAIPAGATVTNAFLYWAATNTTGVADTSVTLDRPGPGGFGPLTITALQSWVPGVDDGYQSVADVTALVQQYGSGAFRVSDIDVAPFADVDKDVLFGGFWLTVFYELDTDPLRNLALFDGLDVVKSGSNQSVTLSGFLVPSTGFTGKLGVIAFEGDNTGTGDALLFNNTVLSNAQNPANNFFNSTRSTLGAPVSVAGDLPQLTGTPGSYAGVDLDIVDITAELSQGQTSAPLEAKTTGDTYYLGGFITSLSTNAPDLTTSTKTAVDVNGGLLLPGDTLEYTITVTNEGNDSAVKTILTDALPPQVTFVPGSITVDGVAKTDMAGDDQAEIVAASDSIVVRLGAGASASAGGSLVAGASTTIVFDVKINSGVVGNVANQGSIQAAGLLGAAVATFLTDGNGPGPGSPPTVVFVDGCATNADCTSPDPICDTAVSPHACVACLTDSDCGGVTSGMVCDPTDTCIDGCRGTGGNGCPTPQVCSSTTMAIGTCSNADAGAGDAGAHDGGSSDAGPGDAAAGDAEVHDAGLGDTGMQDGSDDTGPRDAGTPDSGAQDAGPHDAALADARPHVSDATDGGSVVGSGGGCDCSVERRNDGSGWSTLFGFGLVGLMIRRRRGVPTHT